LRLLLSTRQRQNAEWPKHLASAMLWNAVENTRKNSFLDYKTVVELLAQVVVTSSLEPDLWHLTGNKERSRTTFT